MEFLSIVKGNDYYNIHRKFQVHRSNIVYLRSKNKYREDSRGGNPPLPITLTAYPTPTPG